MILRLSDSLSRGLVVAAALLVGLWLSFFGVRAAIARHDSEKETAKRLEAAVRLEPNNPEYWYILGRYQQYNLEEPDEVLAEESYRKAIALNPGRHRGMVGSRHGLRTGWKDRRSSRGIPAGQEELSRVSGRCLALWELSPTARRTARGLCRITECDRGGSATRSGSLFSGLPVQSGYRRASCSTSAPSPGVYVDVISEAASEKQLAVAKIVWARLLTLHPHLMVGHFERLVSELQQAGEYAEARRVWDEGTSTMNLPPLLQAPGLGRVGPQF